MRNVGVFAWQHNDMQGIPRSEVEHHLNTYKWLEPVKQKKRSIGPERSRAACEETRKLLKAGIVREVWYPTWIFNPVMVRKSDGSWRMCIDFKDLDKACPEDCYPLPEIDSKVDSLAPYRLKCFLDACKGYHQIQTTPEDKSKNNLHHGRGSFLLYQDALRPEKRRSYLPKVNG
jgi:hypothetical protein